MMVSIILLFTLCFTALYCDASRSKLFAIMYVFVVGT